MGRMVVSCKIEAFDRKEFGYLIQRKREEKGMSRLVLANKLGLTVQNVQYYEWAKVMPRPRILLYLCCILDITKEDLKTCFKEGF